MSCFFILSTLIIGIIKGLVTVANFVRGRVRELCLVFCQRSVYRDEKIKHIYEIRCYKEEICKFIFHVTHLEECL